MTVKTADDFVNLVSEIARCRAVMESVEDTSSYEYDRALDELTLAKEKLKALIILRG